MKGLPFTANFNTRQVSLHTARLHLDFRAGSKVRCLPLQLQHPYKAKRKLGALWDAAGGAKLPIWAAQCIPTYFVDYGAAAVALPSAMEVRRDSMGLSCWVSVVLSVCGTHMGCTLVAS